MGAVSVTFIVIFSIVGFFLLLKVFFKLTTVWDKSPTCLVGKTVLITGANRGIGYETALDFAKRGARVILACKDAVRGEEAKTRIIEATGNYNVVLRLLDLSSLASVRKFAVEIKNTEERLDVLVNNAGALALPQTITADGMTLMMQTNHFGPFLLTILLLDLLKKSTPSRIVNVSSIVSYLAKLDVDNLNIFPTGHFGYFKEYCNTKLCNMLFTKELAKKLEGTGIDTNSVHPGIVYTNLHMSTPPGIFKAIRTTFVKLFFKNSAEGAQTTIYAAVSRDLSGISGQHFSDCKKAPVPPKGSDAELARNFWDKSVAAVKLTEDEKDI